MCPRRLLLQSTLTSGLQVEVTEDLTSQDSSVHALATLGGKSHGPSSHEKAHGRVENHEVDGGPEKTGAFSKPC
jgi:hypothetical protein